MEQLETKLKNLTFITILGFVIIIILIIGLYFKGSGWSTSSKTTDNNSNNEVSYDVSKMKTVTGKEAAKLFDEKGTHILYIGRPTCGVCVNLLPNLNQVQEELKYTTNYLLLDDNFRTEFKDLFDKLTIETSITSGGKTYEGTFGEILKEGGFTPIVVVIKDGKMVDGFIGYKTYENVLSLIKKYL